MGLVVLLLAVIVVTLLDAWELVGVIVAVYLGGLVFVLLPISVLKQSRMLPWNRVVRRSAGTRRDDAIGVVDVEQC
jgi:hypothetical protein